MRAISILEWILRIAGLGALVLGLLIWTLQLDAVITIHMLFGLTVALLLLLISLLAVLTRELRVWGIVGILYAFLLPVFGLNQVFLVIGNLHWLIQTAHLLVGIGALALAGIMGVRYRQLKKTSASIAGSPG
jgi:hypothetical protein